MDIAVLQPLVSGDEVKEVFAIMERSFVMSAVMYRPLVLNGF